MASATGLLADVSEDVFTPGTAPTATNTEYSDAFVAAEAYRFNCVCVDTEDTAVHQLLASFVDRIFNAGQLAIAVVDEKNNLPLTDTMAHAAAFKS